MKNRVRKAECFKGKNVKECYFFVELNHRKIPLCNQNASTVCLCQKNTIHKTMRREPVSPAGYLPGLHWYLSL